MNTTINRTLLAVFCRPIGIATALVGLGSMWIAGPTRAQTASDNVPSATDNSLEEIVVTGSLLRGAPPVGSNLISVDEHQAQAQGATTADDLLSTIPQISNLFNNVATSRLNVAPNQIQVVRPNLRNLSPETGSSSSTLVLFDGHRIAGVGVTQSSIDPDLLPLGAIERVEVVTDGGSATYGSDAVGGVINFITRKRFDGVKVDGHAGFADNYHTYDANAIAGKDWGSGSLYAAYTYQRNDAIFGRDRSYIRQVDWTTPALTPTGLQCSPGNVRVSGVTYALPNLTTPGVNACDATRDDSFVPKAVRNSVLAGLHQEFSDVIAIDARAFYGERTTSSYQPLVGTATVSPTNAFYQPAAANPTGTQTVFFNLDPALGLDSAPSGTHFQEWGINTEVDAKLAEKWHLRTLLNYSSSNSNYFIVGPNQTLLSAAGRAANPQAAVNFYNPAATPNLSVLQAIANSEIAGQGKDGLFDARTILDGRLFTLPGGDVSIAAGAEFLRDNFHQRIAPPNAVRGAFSSVAFTPYERHVHSFFGETQVPIVGEDNRMTGIYSLTLLGSVRRDQFSDFGGTTNFKYGGTYKPVGWLALRGNYNTSFNAPSPVDQLGSLRNTISFFPFNPFVRPGDTPVAVGAVAVQGSTPNLQPQTAKTYSFGADIDPLTGLHGSVNYYHVVFRNILGIPTPNTGIFKNFPNNVVTNVNGLSAAQLLAFASLAPNGLSVIQPLIAAGVPVYESILFDVGNYGELDVNGMDFSINYRHPAPFGSIDGSVSGNYTLDRTSKLGPGSAPIDQLADDASRLQMQVTLGADIKNFRAQATLDHSSGFNVVRSASLPQDHVGSFDTVNLFVQYTVRSDRMLLKDLSFSLNVNNVFDRDPPIYKLNTGNGFDNGFTLGRLFMLGVSDRL